MKELQKFAYPVFFVVMAILPHTLDDRWQAVAITQYMIIQTHHRIVFVFSNFTFNLDICHALQSSAIDILHTIDRCQL